MHHPLRFLLGLYPLTGWIIGTLMYVNFPLWYIVTSLTLLIVWMIYESVIDYVEYGNLGLNVIVNVIGLTCGLVIYYLIINGFPIIIHFGIIYDIMYLFLVIYVVFGIVLNISLIRE